MVGEIGSALVSLKTAFDIAKGINEIAKSADIQSAVINLQSQILDAQQYALNASEREAALKKQIVSLEAELAAVNDWKHEKARYELLDLRKGFFAYVLRPEEQGVLPFHALCANCFGKAKKSILQTNGSTNVHQRAWNCPDCKSNYPSQWNDMRALVTAARADEME